MTTTTRKKKMKVTILSGFLGAGKTTLLKRILRLNNEKKDDGDDEKLKMAVIVNDMGEINLDADEIRHSKVIQEDAQMVELHNGCICCTLRGDLLKTVKSLSLAKEQFNYLVIESTGIGEPLPVAQTFTMDVDGDGNGDEDWDGVGADEDENEGKDEEDSRYHHEEDLTIAEEKKEQEHEHENNNFVAKTKSKDDHGDNDDNNKKSLSHYATLDTLVTVVDALNIYDVLGSIETLADKNNVSGMLGNTGAASDNMNAMLVDENEEEEKAAVGTGDEDVNDKGGVDVCNMNVEEETKEAETAAEEDDEIDDRPVSQLWLDQIEFANVIVVSKAPMFLEQYGGGKGTTNTATNDATMTAKGEQKLLDIEHFLKKLNPGAKIIIPREDKYGDLDVSKTLINTGLFDMEEASSSDKWLEELEKGGGDQDHHHTPETEEYGIFSMVFESDKMPFHPDRLCATLTGFGDYGAAIANSSSNSNAGGGASASSSNSNDDPKENDIAAASIFQGVFRSKGQIWLANANAYPMEFHTAGKHISMGVNNEETPFLSAIHQGTWEDEEKGAYQEFMEEGKWTEKFGDRRSKLVFIGMGLNKELIHEKLTAALLTEEESAALGGMKGWRQLSDPFFGGDAYDFFELPEPYGAPYE